MRCELREDERCVTTDGARFVAESFKAQRT